MRRLLPAALALIGLFGGWLVAGVVTAAPASAHAQLITTSPTDGARLSSAPSQVTLQFSEHVTIGPGYARVLDAGGSRVDTGTPKVSGDVVTIPLRGTLPKGGYVVTYRVISEDSHPVAGAYSFAVGNGPLISAQSIKAKDTTAKGISATLPIARWIGYAGLSLAIGIPVLLLLCWPEGWAGGRASRRLRRLAVGGALAIAVGAGLDFLIQGPYTAGTGLGAAFEPSLLSATLDSEAGQALLARATAAVVLAIVLADAWPRLAARLQRPDQHAPAWPPWPRGDVTAPALLGILAVLDLAVVAGTVAVGHAVAGPWPGVALVSTGIHVLGMTIWLGGLAALLLAVVRPGAPVERLAEALPRFSRIAFGAVTAIVITGIIQAVREVPTPGALVNTEYGLILVAKIALVVVVLAVAGVSRVWVQQHLGGLRRPTHRVTAQAFAAGGPGDVDAQVTGTDTETPHAAAHPERHPMAVHRPGGATAHPRPKTHIRAAAETLPSFRRSLLLEAALALVILGLTAVLVGESPASAATAPQPFDVTRTLQGNAGPAGSVEVSLAPATPGINSLHLYVFDKSGQLTQPAGIQVTITNPSDQIGPLDVKLLPAGPGHYIAPAMNIPGAGTWTLAVTVRVDEFTATAASVTFPVR